MADMDLAALLQEFETISAAIEQLAGTHTIEVLAVPGAPQEASPAGSPDPLTPAEDDIFARMYFCAVAEKMLSAGHGFPDVERYRWIVDAENFSNSFEAWCQGAVVNLLIGMWEANGYRCGKAVIVRCVHTGGYHIETYETAKAYFICVSYQFINLLHRFSLLNHELIKIGAGYDHDGEPQDEAGGAAIKFAICEKWNECVPHLDAFNAAMSRTNASQASEVALNRHIAASAELINARKKYAYLSDRFKEGAGPFYLPSAVMWIMYSDQVMQFCLAHELAHIRSGDLCTKGRSLEEEKGADVAAVTLLINLTILTARRTGNRPSLADFMVGSAVFFVLSRIFSHFDEFEQKQPYAPATRGLAGLSEHESGALLVRAINVAGFLSATGYVEASDAAPFWDITAELSLIDTALRFRAQEVLDVPSRIPVEEDLQNLQTFVRTAKWRTEQEVAAYRQSLGNSK